MENQSAPICVIEDNKPIRKLYCTLLKKGGFTTAEFSDGRSAMDWLKENKPLAVVIDILLPDINGTEVMEYIRKLPGGSVIPIVASTGFASPNDREKYVEMGFDAYIPKPVNTSTFADEIKKVIESKK